MTDSRERPSSTQTPPPVAAESSGSLSALSLARIPHSQTVITSERRAPGLDAHELPPPSSSLCSVLFPIAEAVPAMGSAVGVQLGHFRIVAPIRSGGMGAVFEALDLRLNRSVALKILPPSQSRDMAAIERFRNEAQAAAQLDHENIARVFFIGEEQGLHFIAFEFIRGPNLRELVLQKGRLAPSEAVNYTLQVALALDHAAAHGVVHRDIKPSNIIITPTGRAKLVDLGLARNENRDASKDLTAAGTTLGTFDYISPEQAKDPRNVDVRSDIYSLGCTLYHQLTGEPPYPEGTVLQKLLDHSGKESPDPRLKNRQVSPELSVVVRKMMESDPRKRYQTAQQLVHDLFILAHQLGLRSLSSDRLVFLSDDSNRRPGLWERHGSWIATTAVLVVIVTLMRFGMTPSDSPALPQTAQNSLLPETTEAENSLENELTPVPVPPTETPANGGIVRAPQETLNPDSQGTNTAATVSPATTDNPVPPPVEPASSGTVLPNSGTGLLIPRSLTDVFPDGIPNDRRHPGPGMIGPEQFPEVARPNTVATSTPPMNPAVTPQTVASDSPRTPGTGTETTVANATPVTPTVTAVPETSLQPAIALLKADGAAAQTFPTLEAACAEAKDGQIIELRFNGLRQESPLRINSKITIRAGRGFKPVLEFVPKQIPASGYETRMITVTSGALDLVDVHLQMRVKDGISAENWVLLAIHRPDAIRVTRSVLNIINPLHSPASVLEVRGGSSRSAMDSEMSKMNMMQAPLAIDFEESYLTGGADLLQLKTQLPGRLTLKDCLVVLEGTLLRTAGVSDLSDSQATVEFRIDHVTAVLNQGLLRIQGGGTGTRKLSRIIVTASNSIFSTVAEPGTSSPPFVEMLGNTAAEDFRELLVWNGQTNFYDRYGTFWAISSANGAQMETSAFSDWKRHWGTNETGGQATQIPWVKNWSSRPYWELRPEDFALDRNVVDNPALSAGNGGEDAGADLSKLSKLLPLPTAATPSGTASTSGPKPASTP